MNILITTVLWITYFISLFFAVFWLLVLIEKKERKEPQKLKIFPKVTIAIPVYNEEKTLAKTLASVLRLDYPKDKIECIIVNDGSVDRTGEIAKELVAKHKENNIILISQENKGKGAAMNAAMAASGGEYFVCLDGDSFVEPGALKKMLPYFDADDIAAVLPSLKVKNPSNMLQKMQWYEYIINMFYKELMGRLNSVHVAPGPFSVYRKSILEKVGGFDENHNLTEDLEMALRLQSKNYRLIQLLNTTIYTVAPDNLKDLYKQRNRWYKGSILNALHYKKMIFNKNYGDFGIIQMPTILISGVIALVLILSTIYYTIRPYFRHYANLKLIDFDIMTIIKNMEFNFRILDLNYTVLFVAIVMICITLYVIKRSHVCVNEKVIKFGFSTFIFYIFMYFFVLSTMWIGIAFDLIIGKKQKW